MAPGPQPTRLLPSQHSVQGLTGVARYVWESLKRAISAPGFSGSMNAPSNRSRFNSRQVRRHHRTDDVAGIDVGKRDRLPAFGHRLAAVR